MSPDTAAPGEDIVLVDDDPMVAEFLRRVLRGSERGLRVFDDPIAALEHLEAHSARVLLVDTRMPALDGPELIRRLAARGRLEGTRVFLCSAVLMPAHAHDPLDLPRGVERLSKDVLFDRHTLLERLADAPAEGADAAAPRPDPAQPSSAAESSGRASKRSATSP